MTKVNQVKGFAGPVEAYNELCIQRFYERDAEIYIDGEIWEFDNVNQLMQVH